MQAYIVLGQNVFLTATVEKTEELPTLRDFADEVYSTICNAEPISLELEDGSFLVVGGDAAKNCYMKFSETT